MNIEVSRDADLFPDRGFDCKTDMKNCRDDEKAAVRPLKRARLETSTFARTH